MGNYCYGCDFSGGGGGLVVDGGSVTGDSEGVNTGGRFQKRYVYLSP